MNEIKDKNEHFIYQSIKSLISKINWNLDQLQQTKLFKTTNKNGNILISFKRNKEFYLRIKKHLELSGFNVLLNENDVIDLEEITNGVENAYCVLICITHNYRQSINCQIEAQYAFKLNKKIIALIMQNMEVNGWLGTLIDKKATINFSDYTYEECLRKILIELKK